MKDARPSATMTVRDFDRDAGAWRASAAGWLVRAPLRAMLALGYLLVLAGGVFVVTSAYALVTGWALPTTALVHASAWAGWAAQHEPNFPHVLLTLAALGAGASWLGASVVGAHAGLGRDELAVAGFLRYWGVALAVCAFVFCLSAIWAGRARSGDVTAFSIVGLIPFADAANYFSGAHDQAKDGVWTLMGLRRPVAAALRSVLMFFGGFSYVNVLLLQAVLLAGAACLGAGAIARWRGVYAGLAYFALSYVVVRSFLPTFLTEPLALFWGLLAVPFFVEALRTGSPRHALLGFAMITLGLAARPGSLFTVPALIVWCLWRLGHGRGAKLRIAVWLVAILVGVAAGDYLLQRAWGTGQRLTGSNVAYTLCGLSIGTDWSGCVDKYGTEYRRLGNETAATNFLYAKAWENMRAHPEVIVSRLGQSAWRFTEALPEVLWRGYHFVDRPPGPLKVLCFGIVAFGLVVAAWPRRERGEATFWLLVWAAAIVSAAFVYADDGLRVMVVTYPLLGAFVALGFTSAPVPVAGVDAAATRLARYGVATLVATAVLALGVPLLAYATSPARELARALPAPGPDEHLVLGGRRMSGVLVVPDGARLRADVPSIHLADFSRLVERSGIERYQDLLHPERPPLPFGFLMTARLGPQAASWFQYIVPAEVMERRDVTVWRFRVRPWQTFRHAGPYWYVVDKAEALR